MGLQAFDLASQAGRDAARAALQTLALGDPTLKPLIADLVRSLDALPDIPGAAGDAIKAALTGGGERSAIASAAQGLSERTGNRMADYLASVIVLERRQVDLLEQIVGGSGLRTGVLLQPPALSTIAPGLGAQTTVTGGLSIGELNVNVRVVSATDDPDALGRRIGDATLRDLATRISQMLAKDATTATRLAGNVSVS